jgi:hypothetical protein
MTSSSRVTDFPASPLAHSIAPESALIYTP